MIKSSLCLNSRFTILLAMLKLMWTLTSIIYIKKICSNITIILTKLPSKYRKVLVNWNVHYKYYWYVNVVAKQYIRVSELSCFVLKLMIGEFELCWKCSVEKLKSCWVSRISSIQVLAAKQDYVLFDFELMFSWFVFYECAGLF